MKTYALLFVSGFVNDSILTAYYIHAARGHAGICTLLCAAQQILAIFQAYQTLVVPDQEPSERIKRLGVIALGYIAAAYVTVSRV